jgi:lipid-A-disaccharide synthase
MSRSQLVFLSAGEVSGDLHAARLVEALRARVPGLRAVGIGSHRMKEAGVELLADITPYSAVGLLEHLPGARPISRAFAEARDHLRRERPDAVVVVDYQGANVPLARYARELGLPTIYYILPQEWIWGFKGGARKVAEAADLLLSVFEPEAVAYRQAGGTVSFIGHPLLDMLPGPAERGAIAQRHGLRPGDPAIALFPGSRRMEIERLLPEMLVAGKRLQEALPDLQFLLPVASPDLAELVRGVRAAHGGPEMRLIEGESGMGVMTLADAVLAASGTTVLEAAVLGVPVVATYRVGRLAAFVARRLLRVPHVTLPNILTGEAIVPELLQDEATGDRMASALLPLLQDPRARQAMVARLGTVRAVLGAPGAIGRAADEVLARMPVGTVATR